jgi:hypothetical protein
MLTSFKTAEQTSKTILTMQVMKVSSLSFGSLVFPFLGLISTFYAQL